MWKKVIFSLLVVILLLGVGLGGWTIRNTKVAVQAKVIEFLESEVSRATQAEEVAVNQTKVQARLTEVAVNQTKVQVRLTKEALEQARALEADKRAALKQAKALEIARKEAVKRAEAAESAQRKAIERAEEAEAVGLAVGYEKGYDEGYEAALAGGVSRHDPTYQEMKEFLAHDKTNSKPYVLGKYVCVDFAADLNNNAEAAGIRTGYVLLVYRYIDGGKWANFVNAFETTDRGLIFIEPRTDREIAVEVGKYYGGKLIKEIKIIW